MPAAKKHTIIRAILILSAAFIYYYIIRFAPLRFKGILDHVFSLSDFNGYLETGTHFFSSHLPGAGYLYSAFAGLLFVPFKFFGYGEAFLAWTLVEMLLLTVICLLPPSPRFQTLYVCLMVTSFPMISNMEWGQVGLFITTTILAAHWLYWRGKRTASAMLLAMVAAFKYYPFIFVVYYLGKRDWRTALKFAAFLGLFFFVLPMLAIGPANWLEFQQTTMQSAMKILIGDYSSHYLEHVMMRVFPSLYEWAAVITYGSIALAVLNAGLVYLMQLLAERRKADAEAYLWDALLLSVIFLTLPLLVQTSWAHYFIYLPFCQVAVFTQAYTLYRQKSYVALPLAIMVAFSALLSNPLSIVFFADWYEYNSWGALCWADMILLVAIYVIAAQRLLAGGLRMQRSN